MYNIQQCKSAFFLPLFLFLIVFPFHLVFILFSGLIYLMSVAQVTQSLVCHLFLIKFYFIVCNLYFISYYYLKERILSQAKLWTFSLFDWFGMWRCSYFSLSLIKCSNGNESCSSTRYEQLQEGNNEPNKEKNESQRISKEQYTI